MVISLRFFLLELKLFYLAYLSLSGLPLLHAGNIGFCYGRFGSDLPSPPNVAQFLVKQSLHKIRIFDNDQTVIQAFANTGIELVIGIANNDLSEFQSQQQADAWVTSYLAPLLSSVSIIAISVGSEVITNYPNYAPLVLPAIQNIHTALAKVSVASQIQVTTANSMAILQDSFPPSTAIFNQSFSTSFMKPLLEYLSSIGSPVMINSYPYLAYVDDSTVPLDYALFESQQPVVDPNTNLQYTGLFDAQLDALYFAMEGMGYSQIKVIVSETGWPTQGGANERGASLQNAETYNNHLIDAVAKDAGTPHRPNQPLDVYIFSLYNENLKSGAVSERYYGVFNPDGTSIYPLDLTGATTATPSVTSPSTSLQNGTSGTTGGGRWCIAKPGATNQSLSEGINWACGQGGADCSLIQQGKACYEPNTFQSHASYAYNSYYVKSNGNAAACNFNGTAMITNTNPSYGSCKYTSVRSSTVSGNTVSVASQSAILQSGLKLIPTIVLLHSCFVMSYAGLCSTFGVILSFC